MSDKKKVESVLFASGKFMSAEEIAAYTLLPAKKVKKAVEELTEFYEKSDTCLKVFSEEESWKINVKEEYSDFVREVVSDAEIPKSIMETLALIAYKSPVLQSEIIKTRGQHAYDHVAYLEKKKLIFKEASGRSYKLKITDKFHEYFDVEEPEMQEIFKNVKVDTDKIGQLEVYQSKEVDIDHALNNLKKADVKDDGDDVKDYLEEFDKKLDGVKTRVEESEDDSGDEGLSSKDIFGDDSEEEESDKSTEESQESSEDDSEEEKDDDSEESEKEQSQKEENNDESEKTEEESQENSEDEKPSSKDIFGDHSQEEESGEDDEKEIEQVEKEQAEEESDTEAMLKKLDEDIEELTNK